MSNIQEDLIEVRRTDERVVRQTLCYPLAEPARRHLRVPIDLPSRTINRASLRGYNTLRRLATRPGTSIVGCDRFFFPLDSLRDWNRLYGRAGFVQYHVAIPGDRAQEGVRRMLDRVASRGPGVALAVLKRFGPAKGLLSFPREGYNLALDFPLRAGTLSLLDTLDEIAVEVGGRVYLAKDARQRRTAFLAGYPEAAEFLALKRRFDPQGRFASKLSERLLG
jgi:FAD/FMN-containing dehydrogenase